MVRKQRTLEDEISFIKVKAWNLDTQVLLIPKSTFDYIDRPYLKRNKGVLNYGYFRFLKKQIESSEQNVDYLASHNLNTKETGPSENTQDSLGPTVW